MPAKPARARTPIQPGAPPPLPDRRRERSRATRRRMVEAAYRLFCERGYGVPLSDIAAAAGVSVQNIYFAFGNKQTLVEEALKLAVLGDDLPLGPHERPWFQAVISATDPAVALKVFVDNTLPIYERVAPLASMFMSEPDLAELWAGSEKLRLDGFRYVTGVIAAKASLRAALDLAGATDLVFVLMSPATYREFVAGRGWTSERWASWTAASLAELLFA